jgi:hypothetical protein
MKINTTDSHRRIQQLHAKHPDWVYCRFKTSIPETVNQAGYFLGLLEGSNADHVTERSQC